MESSNREWRAILKRENDTEGIVQKLKSNVQLDIQSPFEMNLINVRLPRDRKGYDPYDLDVVYWTDDIMLDAFKPHAAACVIVSLKFKELIKKYNFHDHNFYPVNLVSLDQSKFKEYYLLQILDKRLRFVNYELSELVVFERRPRKKLKKYDGPRILDLDSYFKVKSNMLRAQNLILDFERVVYTVDYDILWGGNKSVVC